MNPEAKHLRERLKVLSLTNYSEKEVDLMRKKTLSQVPWFNRLLLSIRWTKNLDQLLQQRISGTPSAFLYCFPFCCLGGGLIASFVTPGTDPAGHRTARLGPVRLYLRKEEEENEEV